MVMSVAPIKPIPNCVADDRDNSAKANESEPHPTIWDTAWTGLEPNESDVEKSDACDE